MSGGERDGIIDFDDREVTAAPEGELFENEGTGGSLAAAASSALCKVMEIALATLEKALKMQAFYEGKGENYERVRQEAESAFLKVLERFGEVELIVTPFQFLIQEEAVYSTSEDRRGLSFPLFRDGLRRISFIPGLDSQEFEALMKVFAARSEQGAEYNAVTLLWELDLPHVTYRAVDMFMEGVMSAGVGLLSEPTAKRQLDALLADITSPPLTTDAAAKVAGKRPPAASVEAARVRDERKLKGLVSVDGAQWLNHVQEEEVPGLWDDMWPRAVTLVARLSAGADEEEVASYAEFLGGALEELLAEERWDGLQTACQAMAPFLKAPDGGASNEGWIKASWLFTATLKRLATGDGLASLEAGLKRGSDLDPILAFAALLPGDANEKLVAVAADLPEGDGRSRLVEMLLERKADMSELHAMQLTSGTQEEALAAIKSLAPSSSSAGARTALMEAARHKSASVRLEGMRALASQVDESMVALLAENIGSGLHELSELALELLEKLPRNRQGGVLLRAITAGETKKWSDGARSRVVGLLVSWGGAKVDDYLVEGLTAKSLFRRRAVEDQREEIFAALNRVRGERARLICQRALSLSPPKHARARLDKLYQQLKAQRAAAPPAEPAPDDGGES